MTDKTKAIQDAIELVDMIAQLPETDRQTIYGAIHMTATCLNARKAEADKQPA